MDRFNKIYIDDTLNTAIEQQVAKLYNKKIETILKIIDEDDSNVLRKAIWLASILAESENDHHLRKVQDFAILLFLNNHDNIELLKVVYILFSRIGNLAATNHLKSLLNNNRENNCFSENIILKQELLLKRIENSILISDKTFLLTDFQKELLHNLANEQFLSISAPTSSGKSFILKKYIESLLNEKDDFCAFYLVPSRALINQVSEEFRTELYNVAIKNAFIEDEIINTKKVIYVITPERAVKIINSLKDIIHPDLIFIDEIQNVENEDGRGSLFEYVFEELSHLSNDTKIITAGPYISNLKGIFKELFNRESAIVNTNLSPVFQLRAIITLDKDDVLLKLFINNKVFNTTKKGIRIKDIQKKFNSNIGHGLPLIIKALTKQDESNLIYSSRGDYAEKWALKYAESITQNDDLNDDLNDLIKYVKTEIHPKYYLINCLKKRVAFHHSSLSEFVRKEIESLFESGIITTLFCTSTLLEGVNLPADNLFVIRPEKNREKLTDFEFGNLIGRAGRLKNTLFGTIYCISKNNDISWATKYYQADYLKEVKTSSSKALAEINKNIRSNSNIDIDAPKIKNTVVLLRNKALKNDGSLEQFLKKYNIQNDSFFKSIEKSVENITIPYHVVKLNPTIDPILQNQLYKRILNDGIADWVIHPNPNFKKNYRRDLAENLPYKEKSFYWQLDSIITRLNEIFEITTEIWKKDSMNVSVSSICYNAINWLQGMSIGELISNRIKYLSEDERIAPEKRINPELLEDVNKEIKEVIKINLKVVTFSFLKYLKLLVDILESTLNEEDKEEYKLTLALPIQLELGTQEPIIISLISNGIPRTISIKLFEIFKKTEEFKNEINIFEWMRKQPKIDNLDSIYNKFLMKNKYINQHDTFNE